MAFMIDSSKCLGCGACKYVCLFSVPMEAEDGSGKYVIKKENCIGCGQCENICPNGAISPEPSHKRIKRVTIDQNRCIGCTLCSRFCIPKAPHGELKKPHTIIQEKCIKCGLCVTKCKKGAIIVEYDI